jgi:spermidine/putrescine ABC transporter ATP-binding subunit
MSNVTLENVTKRYDSVTAVQALSLEVRKGEFLTLLGPSGCGKTTTLRMIAGFVEPSEGKLYIGDQEVTHLPPQKRAVGMVFQDYALFPHLTVAENIGFGLVERGVGRERIATRVRELLELIRLPDTAARYPSELSGGQQQRIGLARAIAFPPQVLLMDEPLGALDLKMRETMQLELRHIQQELRITTVYVTHDQTEAMTMSDRIAVMNSGRIEQLDTPARIYNAPQTRFVANFVGKVNFLGGKFVRHADGRSIVSTSVGEVICAPIASASTGTQVTVTIRPEHLKLLSDAQDAPGMNAVRGTVESCTFTGNLLHVAVRAADHTSLLVETRPGERACKPGDDVRIGWNADDAVVIHDSQVL